MRNAVRTQVFGLLLAGGLAACSTQPIRTPATQETAAEAAPQKNDGNGQVMEKDLSEGRKNAREAQAHTEASAEYHFAMAQAYVAEGNPDRAIEEYKLTLMFDPGSSLV